MMQTVKLTNQHLRTISFAPGLGLAHKMQSFREAVDEDLTVIDVEIVAEGLLDRGLVPTTAVITTTFVHTL